MDTIFAEVVNKVVAHYPIEATQIYLLSYKGKKAVWSIQTPQGEVILKKVPFDENHIRFMVHAIDYLESNGVNTPGVIKTNTGDGFLKSEGEHFVMFECVYGRSPEYENEDELVMILQGMASFHRASRGIESPTGVFPSFLLDERRKEYEKKRDSILEWKTLRSQADEQNEFDRRFLQYADHFMGQCDQALAMLDQSDYDRWADETRVTKMLCHQDYAAGNLAIADDGLLYVYDMDSLTVDVPVRDLRKVLNKVMKKDTQWDLQKMITMLQAYQSVNPLTKPQYMVLAAEILCPHLFYGQVSKYYNNGEQNWPFAKHVSRLEEMISTELSKEKIVQSFLSQLDEVI